MHRLSWGKKREAVMVPQPWKQNPHPHRASVPSPPRAMRILEPTKERSRGKEK